VAKQQGRKESNVTPKIHILTTPEFVNLRSARLKKLGLKINKNKLRMISLHFSRHALISLNYRSEKGSESQCRIPFEFIPSERAKEIERQMISRLDPMSLKMRIRGWYHPDI